MFKMMTAVDNQLTFSKISASQRTGISHGSLVQINITGLGFTNYKGKYFQPFANLTRSRNFIFITMAIGMILIGTICRLSLQVRFAGSKITKVGYNK